MTNNLLLITNNKNKSSFTLIELLVVLALVAILSVVVVLTLNPAELIKQARDSNRLSDLATINTALNLFSADVTSGFMGTSTVVYVSLPDNASSTCGSWGLPTLPSGYTYNCVTTANLRNTNGTGWIPVNFQRISSNSPISQLPIDPINTTSTRLYYTYVSGGSWELNATVEASKNKLGGSNDLVSKDGGSATSMYELGNNLNLNPIETGDSSLVGYWNFEEGPNATSTDRSGYGNHGTWYGTSTAQQHYTTGKVGSYAGWFNGGSDYISAPPNSGFDIAAQQSLSLSAWIKTNGFDDMVLVQRFGSANVPYYRLVVGVDSPNGRAAFYIRGSTSGEAGAYSSVVANDNQWHLLIGVRNASSDSLSVYLDGSLAGSISDPSVGDLAKNNPVTIGSHIGLNTFFNGLADDVRIYNRALSAAEVLALYNATK